MIEGLFGFLFGVVIIVAIVGVISVATKKKGHKRTGESCPPTFTCTDVKKTPVNSEANQEKGTDYNLPTQYPYVKKMLLTKTEYSFYNILKRKCDQNNLLICPKVRMEDFLAVTDKKNILKYRGYIRSRHIDFMICDSRLHLLAGVELDDNSHHDKDAVSRDEFKNKVFETINMPLFRIKVSQGEYEDQINEMLNFVKQTSAVKNSPQNKD